ncbi:MAG: hypothetical protein GWN73_35825, partial [Actinobacteria bacterium]|nr:hypothetical protein [Actinomycetota bacterium]NIS35822.1 hypothetical protein [Actinomycetota bacterium]NIU70452.1 hypothetical protein [Actinomycetota bacterium]NIW32337.1 hypothetical protein [Actinomycetota bacterium]
MSVYGVARDLAAHYATTVNTPDIEVEATGAPTQATVRIEDPERCPRFTAREISGVAIGPAPL